MNWWAHRKLWSGGSRWIPVDPREAARCALAGVPVMLSGQQNLPALNGGEVLVADRQGWLAPKVPIRLARGPEGRGLCRWCHREVPLRRRNWCSEACIDKYRLHTDWNFIRAKVHQRDKGVCASCGHDLDAARDWWNRILSALCRIDPKGRVGCRLRQYPVVEAAIKEVGLPPLRREWWEADHIEARAEGGSDHPDNLRTLCVPCHKDRTRRQQARWARERRDAKSPLFRGTPQRALEGGMRARIYIEDDGVDEQTGGAA